MQSRFIILMIFSISLHQAFAADTTSTRKPWYITISAGYTYNTVDGSILDFYKSYDAMTNTTSTQRDNGGYQVFAHIQKNMSGGYYIKSGMGFIHKQVNPIENAFPLYKDSLNTSYLSVPVLAGIQLAMDKRNTARFFVETGFAGNFKITDKTYAGPDRVEFKTAPVVLNFQISAGFNLSLSKHSSVIFQYTYSSDLTSAYTEKLYSSATGRSSETGNYKYHTSAFSFGVQWQL